MHRSLLVRKLLPSLFWYALLIVSALGADFLLHRIGWYWVGRHLGIAGSALLAASFVYSLRKRQVLRRGSPKRLLALHELLSWIGVLMILVHAGIHFNALLPWLAVGAMLVAAASGFTGRYLLNEARQSLKSRETASRDQGLTADEAEYRLFLDSLTVDLMSKWRSVHIPITVVFGTLALIHAVSILVFWRW